MSLAHPREERAPATDRRAGGWGLAFTALLLVGAGMASVPSGSESVAAVRGFYTAHAGVVAVAQAFGLLAAAAFVPFALHLRPRLDGAPRLGALETAGLAVASAAALTAVPPLWLAAVARGAGSRRVHQLAVASDLSDVVLFGVIAVFVGTLAAAAAAGWLRVLSCATAVLAAARAVELAVGSGRLEVVAPVAFVGLVVLASGAVLARRSPVRPRSGRADRPTSRWASDARR